MAVGRVIEMIFMFSSSFFGGLCVAPPSLHLLVRLALSESFIALHLRLAIRTSRLG